MIRSAHLVLAASACAALVLLAMGCGGGDEELPDPTSRPAPEAPARAVGDATPAPAPVPTPPGRAERAPGVPSVAEQLSEKIELPDFFPEDGPVYPGAEPSLAQQQANGRVSLMFGADASVEEAAKVMAEASEAKGWTIVAEDLIEDGIVSRATKEGRNLLVLTRVMREEGQEDVTLVAVSVDP